MEVVQERIRREYDVEIHLHVPSVVYKVKKHAATSSRSTIPSILPDPGTSLKSASPTIKASIHIPNEFLGDIMGLVMEKRGSCDHYHDAGRVAVWWTARLPLTKLSDFNDRLKSITVATVEDYELGDTGRRTSCAWTFSSTTIRSTPLRAS